MAELLLDASETLFTRLCSPFRLAGDCIVSFVVPTLRLPVVAITNGSVGVMLPGLAIFSSSSNVSGGAEVLLFIPWNGVAAFTGLLCLLWALPLSDEFRQLPYQTLIDETECLHLVTSDMKSSESIPWLSAINIVLLVLHPRRVGLTPTYVSSRYHQSLRNQLICKGTVVPIDDAKLMVLFLSKLG